MVEPTSVGCLCHRSRLKSALPSSDRSAHAHGGGLLFLYLRVILLLSDLLLCLRQTFGLRHGFVHGCLCGRGGRHARTQVGRV